MVSEVAAYVGLGRPTSVRDLIGTISAMPESCDLAQEIVTGAALGGEVRVRLGRDGSYRFSGRMRATGFTSHTYRITAIVRRPDGVAAVAFSHSGTVYGSDTPGDREDRWEEIGNDPQRMQVVRNLWPQQLAGGTLEVTRSSELAGVLGAAEDVLKVVVTFLAIAYTAGAGVAAVATLGSEIGDAADVDMPTWGGIAGLGVVAGGLVIWGPLAIGPAFLAGVAVGTVVESMIEVRRVRPEAQAFAVGVFGNTIDFTDVRLTSFVGVGGRPFVAPTFDGTILVNLGDGACLESPTTCTTKNYPKPGQLFIHELTHVWQLQHRRLDDGWAPGWLCERIFDGEYEPEYFQDKAKTVPTPWDKHGVEAQATIVDRWYSTLSNADKSSSEDFPLFRAPNRSTLDFHYIENNLRAGSS